MSDCIYQTFGLSYKDMVDLNSNFVYYHFTTKSKQTGLVSRHKIQVWGQKIKLKREVHSVLFGEGHLGSHVQEDSHV